MSKFGVQPGRPTVRRMMRDRRWKYRDLAAKIGVTEQHLQRALAGDVHPADEIRTKLPRLTGVPLDELFTEDALSAPYGPQHNPWKELAQ